MLAQAPRQEMDACARDSAAVFARGKNVQAPSLVHRMASDEASKDAIIAEIHRFFIDDSITAEHTQKKLAAIARALQ